MQAKPNFIVPLSDASAGLSLVGGKGASLARLATAGLPVPPGFHITTAAYRRFVAEHGLQEQILTAVSAATPDQPATLEEASCRIGQLFGQHAMPDEIAEEIRRAYAKLGEGDVPVAVRSSATAEDLPELSFAGQQETYLNVQGAAAVQAAVQRCWGSLWTPRAIGYRLQHGIDQQAVSLAAVVQRLVPAEAAGILFTADPVSGQRDRALISASWGLGEAVVGGLVTPDSLTVEKASGHVLNRQTADKQVMTVRTASATEEQPVPENLRQAPVLDDAAAAQLTALGVQIEQLYGQPMDIEWAWVEGQFAILQARPITALPTIEAAAPLTWPKLPRGVMYGRTSFAEQIPNPVSPLFATLGLRMADIPTQELMKRFTKAKVNYAYVPVNGYVFMIAGLSFPELVAYARMTGQITSMVFHAQEHCLAARQEFVQVIQAWEAKDIAALSPSELLSGAGIVFQEAVRLYTHLQAGTVPLSTISEASFTQFYNRLVRRKGNPAATTFLLGSETVALRAEKALFDLATWCRERPALANYLRQAPASQVAQALPQPQPPTNLSTEDWAAWQAQFEAYLAEYGQVTYDLDFANAVPAEQPTALLETVKMYLQGGGSDPYARQQATLERRTQATAATLARLHWPLKGWFQRLLRWAQDAAPGREDSLADLGLGHPLIRRYLNELGRRLAEGGAIPNAESIYWLEEAEVQESIAALEASRPLPDLSGRIPPRQADRQRYLKITPPAILPEKSGWSALIPWHRTNDDQSTLHGLGTSAGQVTARACVLIGPDDFPRMRPGDVLVAVTTTPAWTPLFALASAVVTDIGGPLSHSSIVAREYGIPAVMATGSATRRIQDGQIITVDGTKGEVFLETPEEGQAKQPARSLEWKTAYPNPILIRGSTTDLLPDIVSPLFATLGMSIATKVYLKMYDEVMGLRGEDVPIFETLNGYIYLCFINGSRMGKYFWVHISTGGKMLQFGKVRAGEVQARCGAVVTRWRQMNLGTVKAPELLAGVRELFEISAEFLTVCVARPLPLSNLSELEFSVFYNALIKRKEDPAATAFLLGLENMPLRAEKSLFDLAQWAKAQAELVDYLGRTPSEKVWAELQSDPVLAPLSGEFATRFAAHLAEFGHIAYDLDFMNPVPADYPIPMLEALKVYLAGQGNNPYARQQAQAMQNKQAEQAISQRLESLRRKWFQKLLSLAQEYATERENAIANTGLPYPQLRRLLRELGLRLTAGGAIAQPEDIYWLKAGEVDALAAALEMDKPLSSHAASVESRKAEWKRARKAAPPTVLPENSWLAKMMAPKKSKPNLLTGKGTSIGQVTAPACVLRGPEDFGQMHPGDVIVAVATTPAWTPLFAMASAVVTDMGGFLSHSSIVAREYGIPAVMGTGVATRRIRSGQQITVDGTAGRVSW